MPKFCAIIPAAGQSTRFGAPTSKLLAELCGKPVMRHTLERFLGRADVLQIVIPTRTGGGGLFDDPQLSPLAHDERILLCEGGNHRAQSVRNALSRVDPSCEWVAVHDGARPLVSQSLIDRTLSAAVEHGAAVGAMPVALTIKQADGPLPAKVLRTVPRHALWAMQTPQIMRRSALIEAFERCPIPLEQVTDDVQLLELIGHDVWLVPGEERNLKITTRMDLEVARLLIEGEGSSD